MGSVKLIPDLHLQGLRAGGDGLALRSVPAGDQDEEGGLQEVRQNGPEALHRQSSGERLISLELKYSLPEVI